jgi:hypothetical protein
MPSDGSPSPVDDGPVPPSEPGAADAVARLRDELASIDDVAVADRVAVFESANATLTAALAELDEV